MHASWLCKITFWDACNHWRHIILVCRCCRFDCFDTLKPYNSLDIQHWLSYKAALNLAYMVCFLHHSATIKTAAFPVFQARKLGGYGEHCINAIKAEHWRNSKFVAKQPNYDGCHQWWQVSIKVNKFYQMTSTFVVHICYKR